MLPLIVLNFKKRNARFDNFLIDYFIYHLKIFVNYNYNKNNNNSKLKHFLNKQIKAMVITSGTCT